VEVLRRTLAAPLRGLALAALSLPVFLHGLLTLVMWGPVLGLCLVGLVAPPVEASRRVTNGWRRLVAALSGVPVPVPYRPSPPRPVAEPDGTYIHGDHIYRTARAPWLFARFQAWGDDPATGRDLAWMLCYPFVGGLLAAIPLAIIVGGIAAPVTGYPLWTLLGLPLGIAVAPALTAASAAWSRWRLSPIPPATLARKVSRNRWIEHNGLILVRLCALGGLALLGLPLLVVSLIGIGLGIGLGMVFLLPPALDHFRWLANLRRSLAGDWSGVPVAVPYRPLPEPELRPDGRYRVDRQLFTSVRMARFDIRFKALSKDPTYWRDLLWLVVDPVVGTVLALAPALLICVGGWSLVVALVLAVVGAPAPADWYGAVNGNVAAAIPVFTGLTLLGFWLAPRALRAHGYWTSLLLRPTRATVLAQRVELLSRSRADAVDAQALEVRRIERDLHDGAQARLVAVGLTLGAIEQLMDTDPAAARMLLAQARDTSATALAELRDLVRGIHPPVLSERGLGDAVRALALDSAVRTEVTVDLPGRFAPAVESAAYFAVSEALANAVRHSGGTTTGVDLRYHSGLLRMTVRDDGRGGADASRGTGLRGIERRLGTFDGTVTVHSPPGGPTVVTMELPCALSSPKTSTSSATA
jgi:signal transduction histidine kinase